MRDIGKTCNTAGMHADQLPAVQLFIAKPAWAMSALATFVKHRP